jgi:hypothetical protein
VPERDALQIGRVRDPPPEAEQGSGAGVWDALPPVPRLIDFENAGNPLDP